MHADYVVSGGTGVPVPISKQSRLNAPMGAKARRFVMAQFKSFTPGVEVRGEVIQAFVAGFPPEVKKNGLQILEKHGIHDAGEGEFCPLQSLLDAMQEISDRYSRQMLYRIGTQIAHNAKLPPGLDSLETCLQSIDVAYHMNHRGGDIGEYIFTDLGEEGGLRKAKMVCANPYPCAFDRGVVEGFASRFKPPGCRDVLVREDESQPCRRNGAESCTYIISWL